MVAHILGSQLQGFRNAGAGTVKDGESSRSRWPDRVAGSVAPSTASIPHGHEFEDWFDRLLLGDARIAGHCR